jgi:hypothetical protein
VQTLGILVGMVIAHLVAGCYHPEVVDCTVQCSAPTDCTGGQVCNGGWCLMPSSPKCPPGGAELDAATVTIDSRPVDAPDFCELGCNNGSCVDGVCVIDCSVTGSCPNDVTCPANLPCRIVCGDNACGHKLICGLATSCEILCSGENACADDIQCNTNRCSVTCSGTSSCKRRTRCTNACACDVTCTGAGSCAEPSECPASTCKLGNGCTSLIAGCNDC